MSSYNLHLFCLVKVVCFTQSFWYEKCYVMSLNSRQNLPLYTPGGHIVIQYSTNIDQNSYCSPSPYLTFKILYGVPVIYLQPVVADMMSKVPFQSAVTQLNIEFQLFIKIYEKAEKYDPMVNKQYSVWYLMICIQKRKL